MFPFGTIPIAPAPSGELSKLRTPENKGKSYRGGNFPVSWRQKSNIFKKLQKANYQACPTFCLPLFITLPIAKVKLFIKREAY